MDDFENRVAVVTGAASGIGRAIADRCAREGVRVVLADVEQGALDQAVDEQFYIWPGDEVDEVVRTRFDHILQRTNPDPRPFG